DEQVDDEPEQDGEATQFLRFDADELPEPGNEPEPPAPAIPLPMPEPAVAMPTPAVPIPAPAAPIPAPGGPGPAVVSGNFQVGDDDLGGTIFSTGLAATHKPPAAAPPEQPQVLAVPCARGHANAPGSRLCRMCSAPVDSSNPRLINRPALAGVHSTTGEFANLHVAVLIGRSPDAAKAPQGAHLMRVASPSSDISRSHIIVTPRDWSVIVTDLDSTNGTTIIPVGEQPFILANGESVQVDLGTVLDLGDGVSVRIEPPRG
ncbi:FHA domain-containing protein, partial [Tessaracoccus sp.]